MLRYSRSSILSSIILAVLVFSAFSPTNASARGEISTASLPAKTGSPAAVVSESDPIWCPEGQAPTPGANGCTQTFPTFDELLKFISGNMTYQGAGIIYVQQGAYSSSESSIDLTSSAYDLSNINQHNLTITGGWNPSNGTIDPQRPSTFSVPIIIGSSSSAWGGTLTINNISIDRSGSNGFTLHSNTDINLTNISVTNTENGYGADLHAGGNVTIETVNFVRNKVAGAMINALGSVAVSNSNFSNRPDNRRRLQVQGLIIVSEKSVSLFNVQANGNREVGANINAKRRVTIVLSSFSWTKTINSGEFLGYGLQVVTPGIIDLDTVTANDNFLWGASLDAGRDVNIVNSTFNTNTTESPGFIDDTGLLVKSGGNVNLNNVLADDNRLIGAKIDAIGDVAIIDSSFSSNNGVLVSGDGSLTYYGYGLQVTSKGRIFLTTVAASENMLFGAYLDAVSDVVISQSDFSNQTSTTDTEETGRGLKVMSRGDVFVDNVTLNMNQRFGANIQAVRDIFLDTVSATDNGKNGVAARAACVRVIGGAYTGNDGFGLFLGNSRLDLVNAPAFGGNTLGDISPANPLSCAPALSYTPPQRPAPVQSVIAQ